MENSAYLAKASRLIPNRFLLVRVVSERVRQLNEGAEPIFEQADDSLSATGIALQEVAEGKLVIERPSHLQEP